MWLKSRMRIEDVALNEEFTQHALMIKVDGEWIRATDYRAGVQRATIMVSHDVIFNLRYPIK